MRLALALSLLIALPATADVSFGTAVVPEPGTGLLVIAGLLGVAVWRKVRA